MRSSVALRVRYLAEEQAASTSTKRLVLGSVQSDASQLEFRQLQVYYLG